MSDVIRGLLCARYGLDCPPVAPCYVEALDKGRPTMLLRLQPGLNAALDDEVKHRGGSKRRIILTVISDHCS